MTRDPLAYTTTIESTGLQGEAPVQRASGGFEDTPTTLDIQDVTTTAPLYGRITARMEPQNTFSLDGASWIWYPNDDPPWDYNEPSAEGTRYFRRTVQLDESPTDAKLFITADNLATVYVNGTEVGTSAEGFDGPPDASWERAPVFDVTEELQDGSNVIAIRVERFGNYAGLIGRLITGSGGDARTVDTGGTWKVSQAAPDGWRSPGFDDSGWVDALVIGEYGVGPWGQNVTIAQTPAAVRMAITNDGSTTYTDDVLASSRGIRTTGWQRIPAEFDTGTIGLQVANARVTVVTLEVATRHDSLGVPKSGGPPAIGDGESPTDPDEDDRYEDINGDGDANYADVVDLFEHYSDDAVQNNPDAFDFNDNDRMDFDDIVDLFESM